MKHAGAQVDFVIDINPSKQGKFLAGSGLRVSSPEEAMEALNPGDEIIVMNSNYLDEITAQSDNQFKCLTSLSCKPSHTLRQAQGERNGYRKHCPFPVRAEPVEA
ncbi:MAG: hypothetical protein KGL31_10085 [candidate division NC10 bacterium]|nr:hypothetical protein [candidate division NC10 bacterium]MDE2322246.1 hypothetical protein [candidate division NC10 bacterium]